MKNLIFGAVLILLSAWVSNAQNAPSQIAKYLTANHAGWTKAGGFCEEKNGF